MSSRVNSWQSSGIAVSPPNVQDADESISVTSTVSDPLEDDEYEAEKILYEGLGDDGEPRYLVEWTGFPLEESTFEPESNLGATL